MKMIQEHPLIHWKQYAVNFNGSIIMTFIMLTLIIGVSACGSTSLPEAPVSFEPGLLAKGEDVF